MRVVLLGYAKEVACGASDYTQRLAGALQAAGVCVHLLEVNSWKVKHVGSIASHLGQMRCDILHVQYPASVYRRAVAPIILLAMEKWRRVVTIHEFSQAHPVRKSLCLAAVATSEAAIFTTRVELEAVARLWPWARRKAVVIPIGATVNCEVGMTSHEDGQAGAGHVVYFGLIRPKRGLEEFLEVARRASERGWQQRFEVIGRTPTFAEGYAEEVRRRARELANVHWVGGVEAGELAERLRGAVAAYLPYPDGVSERRSSLLVMLEAGVPVVTTVGKATTEDLRSAVIAVRGAEDALEAIRRLSEDRELREEMRRRGRHYAAARSWERIALEHKALYERIFSRRSRGPSG